MGPGTTLPVMDTVRGLRMAAFLNSLFRGARDVKWEV